MQLYQYVYYVITGFLILSVIIPFIKHPYWIFRVFDYPRFQKFCLLVICLFIHFLIIHEPSKFDIALLLANIICLIYLLYLIIPYTPLGKKMVDDIELDPGEAPLTLLVCNVYQDNKSYYKMAKLINENNPDVVFLLETDKKWQEGILSATKKYDYKIEVPLSNTYGLLFYSKLKVVHQEINYLIDEEIPSIIVDVEYNNKVVRLFGLHPTPPVPQENTESTERDAEILITGRMVHEYQKPSIVFGDLNDVAWSRTTRLFLKTSGMLDARRGRGMYNTFHTKYLFFRWPLDHFFISPHFRLIDMKIEKSVDSDHFPISISLVQRSKDDSEALETSAEIEQEVDEKIEEGIEKGDAN